jgi:hypothetical protein
LHPPGSAGRSGEKRPGLTDEQLARAPELMCKAVLGCLVTAYEDLMEGINLLDAGDRHVLDRLEGGGDGGRRLR